MRVPFDPERFYSARSVAEVLDLDPDTARELAAREGVRVIRLSGKAVRFSGEDLAALLERASHRPPAPRGGCVARTSGDPERAA